MNKKYYAYEQFREDCVKLIHLQKEFSPQSIVGVARGGLSLAHALGEGLNIRDVQSVRTELYDGSTKREQITLFSQCDLLNRTKVLVVDDIADSGETLHTVMDSLKRNFPDVEFRSATLFYKKTSTYEPDFWINEVDVWIEFFWEKDFLVR